MSTDRTAVELKEDGALHRCPACDMYYRDDETARRCEAWCVEHKSCNLDIIKHAVGHEDRATGA